MLSIIVPIFNERFTIREILRRISQVDIPKQVIIVDDGSTDGTREVVRAFQENLDAWREKYPSNTFDFVYQEKNQGKGAAIRAGIPLARHPISLIQDGDLEYDPADYPALIDPILKGHADVVFGSRFAGSHRRVLFFWHSLANKFLTLMSNIFSDLNLTDMETGYKAFRTELLQSIPLRSNRFGFEPEITAKIAKLGCQVYEVPIKYFGRTYAQGKKIGLKDALQAIYVILKYWLIDDLYNAGTAGVRTLRIMEGAGKYNEWLFDQCSPYLGRRVLEMGSGLGNITHFLLDKDLVLATDISSGHLAELKRKFQDFSCVKVEKFDFTDRSAADSLARQEVDSILSMNVLEHIQKDREALANAYRVLQDKGRLVLLVPAHSWLYSPMDLHLHHHRRYDHKELREKLISAGFDVVHQRHLNVLGALGWFVNGRVLKRRLVPSRQVRLFDIVVRLLNVEKSINPPFGLSILMVAEKRAKPAGSKVTPEPVGSPERAVLA